MSIVVRYPLSNVSQQQYDSVRGELERAGEWPPDGCQLHVAFGSEDNLAVSEVWESAEKHQAFGEKLAPRLEAGGIQLSGEPEFFDVRVYETF